MMKYDNENELRAQFDALRKHDGRHPPEFQRLLSGAELRSRRDDQRRLLPNHWIAAAAVIVIAAALLIGKPWERNDTRSASAGVPTISDWQSPTAGLLRTPARELIAPDPLLSSVFDGVTTTSQQIKSD